MHKILRVNTPKNIERWLNTIMTTNKESHSPAWEKSRNEELANRKWRALCVRARQAAARDRFNLQCVTGYKLIRERGLVTQWQRQRRNAANVLGKQQLTISLVPHLLELSHALDQTQDQLDDKTQ